MTIRDALGNTVTIESTERIVSLQGDISEALYSMGLTDRVVGTDTTSLFPSVMEKKPKVGFFRSLNGEGIIALRPTVVLAHPEAGPPAVVAAVRRAGIPWVVIPEKSALEAGPIKIRAIGQALGLPADGDRLADRVQSEIDAARARAARLTRPPVVAYIVYRGNQAFIVGRDGTACQIIVAAGGICAGAKMGILDSSSTLTAEALIAARPDIILSATDAVAAQGGMAAFTALPGVSATPAAKDGRIYSYDVQFTQGLGPRTGRAVAEYNRLFASFAGA